MYPEGSFIAMISKNAAIMYKKQTHPLLGRICLHGRDAHMVFPDMTDTCVDKNTLQGLLIAARERSKSFSIVLESKTDIQKNTVNVD